MVDAFAAVPEMLQIALLRNAYISGRISVADLLDRVLARIAEWNDPALWISRTSEIAVRSRGRELDAMAVSDPALIESLPLFGVPFAVKDNIDVAALPTTAACPAFAYVPGSTAFAVQRLLDAGAILIGKTNLDQFATGLVGVRSPHGAVRQVEFPDRVSGGSSSGSAVAVAAGCVAFSLGTDTAGSGRVPAGFNELVGLKPSVGLVSKRGVVPACQSLDCVSIFAHDVADAWAVLSQLAAFDPLDSFSRRVPALGLNAGPLRIGVPVRAEFYGDTLAAEAFHTTLDTLRKHLAPTPASIDLTPFTEVSALLYDGP